MDKKEYIFDIIQLLGGKKNPRQVWDSIIDLYPEVVQKTDNLKFPGAGQRKTPVARTKEDDYYTLGLLPGAVGNNYREESAKLFRLSGKGYFDYFHVKMIYLVAFPARIHLLF